jgi:hypothetical protein
VNALPDHICEIHHEDGKIVFAFHETVVATIKSSYPPVRLVSERRVPLNAPVGEGRIDNVQPDYGLWRRQAGLETCGLVIEVKHYKRSANSRFGHVLTDYARAFPNANIYLVNHGPIGDAMRAVPREVIARCSTISDLTPPNVTARDALRDAVRKYVGDPVARRSERHATKQADTVLAIDVSGSMSGYIGTPDFAHIMREIVDDRCGSAALIDVRVRALMPLDKLSEALTSTHGTDTRLSEPVRELLGSFSRVLVVTDDDGLNSLKDVFNHTVLSRRSDLVVIEVTDPKYGSAPTCGLGEASGRSVRRRFRMNLD